VIVIAAEHKHFLFGSQTEQFRRLATRCKIFHKLSFVLDYGVLGFTR
jgi:hypothetical protein